MLRRLSTQLKLILLALALVIIPGVLVVVGQSQWAHHRMQEVVTRQIAQSTQREVYVGPISGNLLSNITIDGLAIAEGQHLAQGAMLAADRVRIDYDLLSVLRGHLAPIASIRAIHLDNPRLHVVRSRNGKLNLRELLGPPQKVPPGKRFRGMLYLHNGTAFYEDSSWYVKAAPLQLHLDQIEMRADIRQITRTVTQTTARITDGRAQSLNGRVIFDAGSPFVDVSGTVSGIDAAWGMRTFGLQHGYTVTDGRLDLSGSVFRVATSGKPVVDFSGTGLLHGITVSSSRLPYPLRLDGTSWGSRDGFRLRDIAMTMAGSRYAVSGSITRLDTPVVDLSIASDHVALASLGKLAPGKLGGLDLASLGTASVNVTALGPAANPDLRVQVGTAQPVTVTLKQIGTIRANSVQIAADVVGAAKPSFRATLRGSQLSIPSLKVSSKPGQWPHEVNVAPMQPFAASVQWCGGAPVAQGDLRVPALRADSLRVTDLQTHATLVNNVVRLQDLRAKALGGAVRAEAALRVTNEGLRARVRGSVRGADLTRLTELPIGLDGGLTGSANASFQAQMAGKRVAATANVSAADVNAKNVAIHGLSGTIGVERTNTWHGVARLAASGLYTAKLEATRAEGLIELQDRLLTLHGGFFRGPDGVGWARGEMNLADRTLDLQVRGAELPLARLAPLIGLKEMKGIGYGSGNVRGTVRQPNFEGHVIVFKPQVRDYVLDAMAADVRIQGDTLEATSFQASRGTAIVSGQGTIDSLGAPPEQMAVQAEVQGQGLRISDVARMAHKDWGADGLAEFSASVTGSVGRPQARGVLRISNAQYENVPIARATIPFALDQHRLTVSDVEASVLDSPLGGRITVDFANPTEVEGYLTAGKVRLEGLAPLFKSGLPIRGEATIPSLWLRGPVGNLTGGGQIIAPEINLGGETIRDVDANITLARGQVQLQKTRFGAAGGNVVVEGAYDYSSSPRTVAAKVSLQETDVPDLLYLALPVVRALDTRPADQQAQTRLQMRSYALRLKGLLEGKVNLSGPVTSPTAVADIRGQHLVLDQRAFPDVEGKGTVNSVGIQGMAVALRQGEALVTVDGDLQFNGPIKATVEGSGINLAQLRPWIPLTIPYGGRLGFTIMASGETRRPDLTASVDVSNPSFAGVQFDVLTLPVATVREGQIAVETPLVIRRGQQKIAVDGHLPFSWQVPVPNGAPNERRPGLIQSGEVKLGGRIDRTEVAFVLPLIDEYLRSRRRNNAAAPVSPFRWATVKASGTVDSSMAVTGTVADPTLVGFLKVQNASLQPAKWKNPIKGLQADLALTGSGRDNLLDIRSLQGTYDQTTVQADGKMYLDYLTVRDFWRNRFDVKTTVSATKQGVPGGVQLADVRGGLSLQTQNGAQVVTANNLGFGISKGRGTLTGQATMKKFALADLANNQFDLHFNFTPGKVAYSNVIAANLAGDLALVTPPNHDKAVLRGNWTISQGAIGLAGAAVPGGIMHALSSRYPSPDLDLQAGVGKNVRFRGSGVTAPLEPNPAAVRVAGTPQAPVITGSAMARGGATVLPAAELRINYFGLNYTLEPVPGDRHDPVEMRLRGTVQGLADSTVSRSGDTPIRISVNVSGTLPDHVVVHTSSDPTLTETQIYALLGGIPFTQLPGIATGNANVTQIVSQQFLATLANAFRLRVFEPLEDKLRRLLGLSELGITFYYDQPAAVRVGKYVVRDLLVTYESPLGGPVEQWDLNLSYQLPGGRRIAYHTDERDDQRLEAGYGWTFW